MARASEGDSLLLSGGAIDLVSLYRVSRRQCGAHGDSIRPAVEEDHSALRIGLGEGKTWFAARAVMRKRLLEQSNLDGKRPCRIFRKQE